MNTNPGTVNQTITSVYNNYYCASSCDGDEKNVEENLRKKKKLEEKVKEIEIELLDYKPYPTFAEDKTKPVNKIIDEFRKKLTDIFILMKSQDSMITCLNPQIKTAEIHVLMGHLRSMKEPLNMNELKTLLTNHFMFSVYVKRNSAVEVTRQGDGLCFSRCLYQLSKRTDAYQQSRGMSLLTVDSLVEFNVDVADKMQREAFLLEIKENIMYLRAPNNVQVRDKETVAQVITHLEGVEKALNEAVERSEDLSLFNLPKENWGNDSFCMFLFRKKNKTFPLMHFQLHDDKNKVGSEQAEIYRLMSIDNVDYYGVFRLQDLRTSFAKELDNAVVFSNEHVMPLKLLGNHAETNELERSFQMFCKEMRDFVYSSVVI